METTSRNKTAIIALAMLIVCGTANAQRRRWHTPIRPVVSIVARPAVTVHVSNRFNQKERLAMAYLRTHSYMTIKQYSKMTRLSKTTAEAELDAFASGNSKPITAVLKGKKKVYVKV